MTFTPETNIMLIQLYHHVFKKWKRDRQKREAGRGTVRTQLDTVALRGARSYGGLWKLEKVRKRTPMTASEGSLSDFWPEQLDHKFGWATNRKSLRTKPITWNFRREILKIFWESKYFTFRDQNVLINFRKQKIKEKCFSKYWRKIISTLELYTQLSHQTTVTVERYF